MESIANFYNITTTELSAAIIVFNLLFSFALQLAIVYVYKKTRHGLSYSQSFIFTMIIVGTLGTAIMMAVQNNVIGALAIFGAFTLIRFRSILKETSDLAYIFFALVVGISVGMGHYPLALITTLFISAAIYLFYRFGFGSVSDNFDYLIIFNVKTNNFAYEPIATYLNEIATNQELLHEKHYGETTEYSISVKLKKNQDTSDIISNLKKAAPSIGNIELITGKNTSEF